MEFHVHAYDGTDEGALERRSRARRQHLEGVRRLQESGRFINGGAILNDAGEMIGSTLYVTFSSRSKLDEWLRTEPYVTERVWKEITVEPIRLVVKSKEIGSQETNR